MRRSNSGIACVGLCCANSYRSSIRACTWDGSFLMARFSSGSSVMSYSVYTKASAVCDCGRREGKDDVGVRRRDDLCGLRFLVAMAPSLSGCMMSLAIWHAATIHRGVPPCHLAWRGFAFTPCQGVSSIHDEMPMPLLRPCQVYSPCP